MHHCGSIGYRGRGGLRLIDSRFATALAASSRERMVMRYVIFIEELLSKDYEHCYLKEKCGGHEPTTSTSSTRLDFRPRFLFEIVGGGLGGAL